jgi:hypothetical protein
LRLAAEPRAQISDNLADLGVTERVGEGRHDRTDRAFRGVDAFQYDMDHVARIGRMEGGMLAKRGDGEWDAAAGFMAGRANAG